MLGLHQKNIKRPGLIAMSLTLLSGTALGNPTLGVENDAEYASMIEAMRAAEYVRTDMILAVDERPRLYAGLAGLIAFSERNPDASDEQLSAFLDAWDAALCEFDERDPDLDRAENFHAAVHFARVDDSALDGMDVNVGNRALELLGETVPDPDGFESIQLRMVRFETALARGLHHRPAIYEMLVSGFYGQDSAGNERASLPTLLNAYFLANGVDPALGMVRGDLPEIEAGLASMPTDYTAYQAAIAAGAANDQLRTQVEAEFTFLRDRLDSIVDGLATSDTTPSLIDGLDVTPQEMQDIVDDLQDRLMETAESRAFTAGAAFLMLQSQFDDITTYGTNAQDFSAITLETNNTFAYIESSLSISSNLTQAYFNYGDSNYASMANNLFGTASDVLGLVGLSFGGPGVDEQIFDQVVELRQQVEDMRLEMHERFDRIDQQLDIMYDTIVLGFDQIGDQIGDLQDDVDSIVLEIASARSQLRRLEAALYGVAEDILLTNLTNEANIVLDYRDENGVDLPYLGGSPDFITASESFFTYATVTSQSEAFAGSRTNPTVNLTNADEYVGDGPVARYLNDLAVLPTSLGLPALTNRPLAGIEPWTQAAAAYAQLARESPWYFNFRYGQQLDDYNADPMNESLPELDRIVLSGQRLEALVERIREINDDGQSALFDALTDNYRDAADEVQTEIDAIIAENTPAMFSNGSVTINYWMQEPQNVAALLPDLNNISSADLSYSLPIPGTSGDNGYDTFCLADSIPEARRTQLWHLLRRQERVAAGGSAEDIRARVGFSMNGSEGVAELWIGDSTASSADARRIIRYDSEQWTPVLDFWIPAPLSSSFAAAAFGEVWLQEGLLGSTSFDNEVTSDRQTPSIGSTYSEASIFYGSLRYRITIRSTFSSPVGLGQIYPRLHDYRASIYSDILSAMADPTSALFTAAEKLDHAESLIDAYVTLGMSLEMQESEVLRAALRGTPDLVNPRELGLRSGDVFGLVTDMFTNDTTSDWADPGSDASQIGALLRDRIDIIEEEIERGLQRPSTTPGYVGWMLAELIHLRETAFELATDDTYSAGTNGSVVATPSEGLLNNDVMQEYSTVLIDLSYATDPEYTAPQHGQVTFNADGSFSYQADPGFVGSDSFTYRATTTVNGTTNIVFSDPATVVIKVSNPACNIADLAEPYAELNFFDVSAFLIAFNTSDPAADLNDDSEYNFFDVSEFLTAFGSGCP
ncbi:MAG: Ig-like domain-containing protein [Phycisphaerales bacterium JB047]